MPLRFTPFARITCASVVAALAAVAALVLAAPARAHAVLLASDPPAGATLAVPPDRVVLTFSESVSLALGGVAVYAPDGHTIANGPASVAGNRVTVPIGAHGEGTHAVSWRVLSADGHPVSGAFVFHVGQPSAGSLGEEIARREAETDSGLELAFALSRTAYLLGILLAAGGAIFAAVVVPTWRARWLVAALAVAAVALVVAFFLEAAIAAGIPLSDTLDWTLLRMQADTVYGNGTLFRLALTVVALGACLAARRDSGAWSRRAAAATGVCLVGSLSITGHALSTDPIWLRLPLDMLHSLCAALWLGGLLQLWHYVQGEGLDPRLVGRFSQLAFAAVCGLVVTGSYAALAESGYSLSALIGTTYGWLLTGKLAAFAATIPLAYLNRSRNVPGLALEGAPTRETLRRFVAVEAALLLAVVGVTAWLIQAQPARHAAHRASAASEDVEVTKTLASGARLRFIVRPAAVGPNAVEVTVRRPGGAFDASVSEVTVTAASRERGIAPLRIPTRRIAPGRAEAPAAVLPLAGRWQFVIAIRRGEFDEERTEIEAEIAGR